VDSVDKVDFSSQILDWFQHSGRKNLPWQINPTPYRVWISEIMLQQTQVKTVIPYFKKFMAKFPNITDLASASDEQVMALWSGLGYYSRARNIHKTAIKLCSNENFLGIGVFPQTVTELQILPGIGRSTAGAILALSMDLKAAILDGNVKRVLARCFAVDGWPGRSSVAKQLWQIAEILTPEKNVKEYTQALRDWGAGICTPKNFQCNQCPINNICQATNDSSQLNYPGKKPKKKIPTRHQYFCLLLSKNAELLLEKRPPTGIWGGLWTPISCDLEENLGQYLIKEYSIECSHQERLTEFKHSFSHFHLHLIPIKTEATKMIAIAENQLRWQRPEEWLNEGIPKPVRTMILNLIQDLKNNNLKKDNLKKD